jgi:hypothetical protein
MALFADRMAALIIVIAAFGLVRESRHSIEDQYST